jgi:hypothetical protein
LNGPEPTASDGPNAVSAMMIFVPLEAACDVVDARALIVLSAAKTAGMGPP